MSHSKYSKRGRSLYVEKFNPAAKKHINTCAICGSVGYSPTIAYEGFDKDLVHRVTYEELTKLMKPLYLDRLGRCSHCAALTDSPKEEK